MNTLEKTELLNEFIDWLKDQEEINNVFNDPDTAIKDFFDSPWESIDTEVKNEFVSLDKFGMTVEVERHSGKTPVVYNNVHEVHVLYDNVWTAIESNIHKTGSTLVASNIKSIRYKSAKKIEPIF